MVPSLAVLETFRQVLKEGQHAALKSPNDLLISGRKACGILSESKCREERISWAVVGIGVNLYQTDFPDRLQDSATSLKLCGCEVRDPLELFHDLTRRFEALYQVVMDEQWSLIEERYEHEIALTIN